MRYTMRVEPTEMNTFFAWVGLTWEELLAAVRAEIAYGTPPCCITVKVSS